MTALNLSSVMDALATAAGTATSLKAWAYPPDAVTAPCIAVGYPTEINLDATFGRSSDSVVIPVWIIVGKAADGKAVRDKLSGYLTGISGVVEALDALAGVSVRGVEAGETEIGLVVYQSLKLSVEVYT
jgi:hypothetical protein